MTTGTSGPLRVLHCPWNIGGHPSTLSRFERELGADSRSVALVADRYGFAADEILFTPAMTALDQDRARRALLIRALKQFDVVHFNFGQTILESAIIPRLALSAQAGWRDNLQVIYQFATWMRDLPLLRAVNKVIVMTYQGDDARQGDYCRAHFPVNAADEVDYHTNESDRWKRRAIRRVARYADRIYALNPDLLHVLPSGSRFLPYANVDPQEWRPPQRSPNTVPLVVHAPTDRAVKGTRFILAAVEQLRGEGVEFDFVLVENMTRSDARRIYECADLLIDQVLLSWYGGLAVELMALGKPVVCYLRPGDLDFVPAAMRRDLPVVDASPTTITSVLGELLTRRRAELPELGRRSRAFVENWHDPRRIARGTLDDYCALAARRSRPFRLAARAR
jgi:hypothetical protein